jgi:hypothetical protein
VINPASRSVAAAAIPRTALPNPTTLWFTFQLIKVNKLIGCPLF